MSHHSQWFPQCVGVVDRARRVRHGQRNGVAFQLVRPAGHVVEQFGCQRHVDRAGDTDRLAVVEGFQLGELLKVLQNQVTEPPDQPAPLGGRHPRPRPGYEGPTGGLDRDVDVDLVTLCAVGQQLTGRRVPGLEGLLGLGIHPLPIDEQLPVAGVIYLDLWLDGRRHSCGHESSTSSIVQVGGRVWATEPDG